MSQLRPYRRRIAVLVVLAALAGGALAELTPAPRGSAAKRSTTTTHRGQVSGGGARP